MLAKLKQLKNNEGFMKYFKNTTWLFGEKILKMTLGLFVGVWVARYLGPEQFGIFSYAISIVGIFSTIATLGLDAIVIRELVKDENRRDELIGTAFWLKLLGSFGMLSILLLAINLISNERGTNSLILIIASASIFQSFNVVDMYFQSKVLSRYVVYVNIITLILSSIVKIVLILIKAPIIAFAWVLLFDSFILACGFIFFYIKKNSTLKANYLRFNKSVAFDLLSDSWPLILTGVIISIYMKIDQVMIKELMNPEAVGQYAAAVRLSEAWYFIPMVITSSLFPAIVNAKKISEELYFSRLQKIYDIMVWIAIIIAMPMTFLSDWIVELVYGEEYHQAGSVLMIHIWTGVFVFLGVAFSGYLTTENLTKKAFYRTLMGAVVNVLLNFILIPIQGISGAAIATIIGQFSANYIYDIFDKDFHLQLKMKTKSFFPIHILKGYK